MTAKTQKQRSAEFRARKALAPEVRGIYAPLGSHAYVRQQLDGVEVGYGKQCVRLECATKRAKEKA